MIVLVRVAFVLIIVDRLLHYLLLPLLLLLITLFGLSLIRQPFHLLHLSLSGFDGVVLHALSSGRDLVSVSVLGELLDELALFDIRQK